jgi:PIN domain nuclease of toxin-antitoxin system
MTLLLDTQVFLWLLSGDNRLPIPWRDAITAPNADVALSVASIWEAIIKHQIGKLPLPGSPETYLPTQRVRHRIASLPIDEACLVELAKLPPHHKDPFDRIIISQAIQHSMTLVTADPVLRLYSVNCLP